MIARLTGNVVEVTTDSAVLDVGGVGYELTCSLSTLAEMQAVQMAAKTTTVYVHTHVREDALQLFGFLAPNEKDMFHSLLKVNGIGPKLAINALSGATIDNIMQMIEDEDVKGLSKLPKVGKKTAEQMILTLKGKLVFTEVAGKDKKSPGAALSYQHREISSALVNLGFRMQDVEKVVSQMPKTIEMQDGIRQALAALTSV